MNYSRIIPVVRLLMIVSLFFLPFGLSVLKNTYPESATYDPLALAGRKVYENSGCNSCHTRYVRKSLADLVRYAPDDYFKMNLKSPGTILEKIDETGIQIGPDLEYLPWLAVDQGFLTAFLVNPQRMNKTSIMPSFEHLFREKLRNDEIIYASGSLKNKHGYRMFSRADALLHYIKVSTLNFYGRYQ